ncbi:hypothetical protein N7523_003175 [Penicillium sp. IBT 18751x]|nr:hypothetical protein N7523_003175 [Penicillium sp. IBT 18751x]
MASRREAQQSDKTMDSWTSSLVLDMEQNLQLEEKLSKDAETPQEVLHRLLSTKSAISTASSFALSRQAAIGTRAAFREIGTGSIGKVYEQPGTPWAFKMLLVDRHTKLWNNYIMHLRIQQSFDALGETASLVEVPRVSWFANKDSSFWDESLDLFPSELTVPRGPREILCMERVFPLPEMVRHALIDVFCNPAFAATAKAEPKNKDCLVRILLGRRRFGSSRPGGSMCFSLRNYKLHLDQIQELNLDAEEYARSMADTLAVLHWHSKIDAMDVEFVLGSTPLDRNAARRILPLKYVEQLPPGSSTYEHATANQDYKKRTVSLWLLDFDACATITMDDAGVRRAVEAFFQTDPYCPRPNSRDEHAQNLWTVFSQQYVATGRKVTTGTAWQSLPEKFIQGIMNKLSNQLMQSKAINQSPAQPRGAQTGQEASRGKAPRRRRGQRQKRGRETRGGRAGSRG